MRYELIGRKFDLLPANQSLTRPPLGSGKSPGAPSILETA
jgi:hypothetical protein